MAFIPVPNVAEAVLIFEQAGQRCVNTLYFEADGGYDTDQLITLGEELVNWWLDHRQDSTTDACCLVQIDLRDLSGEAAPGINYVENMPHCGLAATGSMPNNVTVAVSFRTALRGRSFRGRNYIVGIPRSVVTGNAILTTYQQDLVDAYSDLMNATTITRGEWVVVSRYHLGIPRPSGIGTPVTMVSVDPYTDSQRRRLTGRGD